MDDVLVTCEKNREEIVKITTRSFKEVVFQAFERGQQNTVKCDKNNTKWSNSDIFSDILSGKWC